MRCPYCQQNIRVQGRFCPKCGEQIFGLPVRQQQAPPAGAPPASGQAPAPVPTQRPAAPPPYRPFGDGAGPAQSYDDLITLDNEGTTSPASAGSAAPAGVHPAAGDEVGKTCPYCRFPLKPGEQVITCPACKVPHHADCWSENRGCTTYGCSGTAAAAPAARSPVAPPVLRPNSVLSPPAGVAMPGFEALQQTEFMGRANNAFLLALIGLLACPPISLIGLFMGISVLAEIGRMRANVPAARSKAISAIVLGALSTLGSLLFLIITAAAQH